MLAGSDLVTKAKTARIGERRKRADGTVWEKVREGEWKEVRDPKKRTGAKAEDTWDKGDWAKFAGSLSTEEEFALSEYLGTGYHAINSFLRSSGKAGKQTRAMDEIFKRAPVVKVDAWRGMGSSVIQGLLPPAEDVEWEEMTRGQWERGGKDYANRAMKGLSFLDKGFVSTSKSVQIAKGFVGEGDVTALVKVSGKTKALDIGRMGMSYMGEREVLLQRGTRFKIKEVGFVFSGNRRTFVLDVEAVR